MRQNRRWLGGILLGLVLSACSTTPNQQANNGSGDSIGEFLTVTERLDRIEMDMAMVMQDLALLHGRDPSSLKTPRIPQPQKPQPELRVSAPKATTGEVAAVQKGIDPVVTGSIPAPKAPAQGWQNAVKRQSTSVGLVSDNPELAGRIALHLASYKTLKSLTAGRDVSLAQWGDLFGKTQLFAEPVMLSGELFYRLKAGPIGSLAEAERICGQIQSQDGYCKVGSFSGS